MRRFTPSGSRVTSTPPTVAVPDVGLSSPHNMRIVVDLPAPLLPRKPKISPRRTSKVTLSTATNWPKRRVSPRTSIAAGSAEALGLSANGSLQPRFGEPDVGDGARAIQLRLQARDLRVEDVGGRGDAGAIALADDPLGFGGGADLLVRGAHGLAARVELKRARAHFEGGLPIEVRDPRLERRGRRSRFPLLRRATPAVPQIPRDVDRGVPRRVPLRASRKDARVGAGVVVASGDRDLRTRRGADGI